MSLTLTGTAPNPPNLTTFSSWTVSMINDLARAASPFVDAMESASEVDFYEVGDPEDLDYLQWDYDAELLRLESVRPGYISTYDPEHEAGIDALEAVEVPAAPTLSLPIAAIPSLNAERPAISLPARPDTDVGAAPSDAPSIDEPALPDAPVVSLPTLPSFDELQLPSAPSFSMPSFTATPPVSNLSPPTSHFAYVDPGYTSVLADPLVAKLLYDLTNGGYGIEPDDEDALWMRARDRAESSGRLAMQEALSRAASSGFVLPQGAHVAMVDRARRAVMDAMQEANREIALKRADMYVENRKFTIQEVRQYEQIAIALYNAVQERALNAARALVEMGIAVYDASVRNYSAQLEGYRVTAQVFESRVRAELAKAELYKAQIEAEKLRSDFNRSKVELYLAQIQGISLSVDLYKSRIDAVESLMKVQAQRLEIFRTRVQAYAMKVQAKASEFDMYRAAVQGETAKIDIYKADVDAYEAQVRGEEARIRALTAANTSQIEQYRAQVAQYTARLEGASKAIDARLERTKTFVSAHNANISTYRALVDAILAGVNTKKDAQRMNNEWNIKALDSKVEVTRQRLDQLKLTMGNRIDISKAGASMFTTALSSAISNLTGLTVKSD